jgi:hypothetical protein
MAQKLYDLVVKTGEYQDNQGQTKGRYENVGTMMEGDNGPFIILKRTFNPAGVPNPDCKDSVIVSCFSDQNQAPVQQQGAAQGFQKAPQQVQNQQQQSYTQNAPQQGNYGTHRG